MVTKSTSFNKFLSECEEDFLREQGSTILKKFTSYLGTTHMVGIGHWDCLSLRLVGTKPHISYCFADTPEEDKWKKNKRKSIKLLTVFNMFLQDFGYSQSSLYETFLTEMAVAHLNPIAEHSNPFMNVTVKSSVIDINNAYDIDYEHPDACEATRACMNQKNVGKFYHAINVKVAVVNLRNDNGQGMVARALIWELPMGTFMDRQYGTGEAVKHLRSWAYSKGYFVRSKNKIVTGATVEVVHKDLGLVGLNVMYTVSMNNYRRADRNIFNEGAIDKDIYPYFDSIKYIGYDYKSDRVIMTSDESNLKLKYPYFKAASQYMTAEKRDITYCAYSNMYCKYSDLEVAFVDSINSTVSVLKSMCYKLPFPLLTSWGSCIHAFDDGNHLTDSEGVRYTKKMLSYNYMLDSNGKLCDRNETIYNDMDGSIVMKKEGYILARIVGDGNYNIAHCIKNVEDLPKNTTRRFNYLSIEDNPIDETE